MADKKVIGIDLGSESLKCVALSVSNESVSVTSCQAECLNLAKDAGAEAWREAAGDVLKKWKSENIITDDAVVTATSSSAHTLIRALKIPAADLQQKITEEADKQLPFPIAELDWDYEVIGEDNDQSYVTLAAVKKEITEGILSLFADNGITLSSLESGALALGNVLLHANGGECSEPISILSIGATASNLTVVHGSKVWMRTLPVTGESYVSSLCKALNMSEEDAKKAVLSEINLASSPESDSEATKNVRAGVTRLVMEITRSLTFYKSQLNEEKPNKLLITGGYSAISGLGDFLKERLKMEVEPFNVFQKVEGGSENQLWFGEALGCALASAELTTYSFNLLPKDIQFQQNLNRKKVWIVTAAYLIAAIFAALFIITKIKSSGVTSKFDEASLALSDAEQFDAQINKIKKEIAAEAKDAEEYRKVLTDRDLFTYLSAEITKVIPSNMWISGLKSVTFGEIYDLESAETDFGRAGRTIRVDEEDPIRQETVRLVLIGGCYGDEAWTNQKEDLRKSLAAIPGIAGFAEKALTTFKQYSTFEIEVLLDLNENNIPDFKDIKDSFSKGRTR